MTKRFLLLLGALVLTAYAGAAYAQDAAQAVTDAAGAVAAAPASSPAPTPDSGDTSWMLTSSLLVLMMSVPGLALFYGGLVMRNSVLATLMQTVAVVAIVSVVWPIIGYSISFTEGNGFAGGLSRFMLDGMTPSSLSGTIPESVFVMFQMTFAAITAALLLGSIADRIRFSAVVFFTPLWMLFVYVPVAHWVWGPGGFLGGVGLTDFKGFGGFGAGLDFAGGTVVHINSGVAGLIAALVIGRGVNFQNRQSTPTNLILSVIGTGLLWVGWFGFNAGSALTAGTSAGMAMLVTNSAAAMACLTWVAVEWARRGKPSVAGALSGIVAGLVAITPAAGFVSFGGSIVIGFAAGVGCYFAVNMLKRALKYDDSLDVFGIHGVGGVIGALLTGVFATTAINPAASGLIDGNGAQVIAQLIAVLVVAAYSALVTLVLLKFVNLFVKLRVEPEIEQSGLDLSLHGETISHYYDVSNDVVTNKDAA